MEESKVGIITFHCSDNYGAMLQAYGLKNYLCNKGIRTDIVRYEPPFMTGRHWWVPYVPLKGILVCALKGWIRNLQIGKSFFYRKRNMNSFREKYLVRAGQKKCFFLHQLKSLTYSCYIVGSDQIWNPSITCGFRKAYFGAFKNVRRGKIIAYAASIGGTSLPSKYGRELSRLLGFVDIISVREKEAIPYIQSLYKGKVIAVLDPVFLLEKKEWQRIEKKPCRKGYILIYMTEKNNALISYAKELSEQKNLPVIELRSIAGVTDKDFIIDYEAGPAEFLGYIHKADYVVTNSFHGMVFSIIFKKKFMVFQHSNLGARIYNILQICGLEDRLYQESNSLKIDTVIDWENVENCTKENVKISEEFLIKSIVE